MNYVGLAFSAQMLLNDCYFSFENLDMSSIDLEGTVSCCNPSHKASLEALQARYGIKVDVPAVAPKVKLSHGDSIIVLQISGLPRETREFTKEEIDKASFSACKFTVLKE